MAQKHLTLGATIPVSEPSPAPLDRLAKGQADERFDIAAKEAAPNASFLIGRGIFPLFRRTY